MFLLDDLVMNLEADALLTKLKDGTGSKVTPVTAVPTITDGSLSAPVASANFAAQDMVDSWTVSGGGAVPRIVTNAIFTFTKTAGVTAETILGVMVQAPGPDTLFYVGFKKPIVIPAGQNVATLYVLVKLQYGLTPGNVADLSTADAAWLAT
jgi:hypothetical protein